MNGDYTREINSFSKNEILSILKKSTKISNCDLLLLQMNQTYTSFDETKRETILADSNSFKIVIGIYTKEQDKIVFEKKKEITLNDFEINSSLFDEEKYRKIMMKKSGNAQKYIDNFVEYLTLNQVLNDEIFKKVDVLMESCIAINPVQRKVQDEEVKPVESVYSKFLTMQNGIPFTKIS